MCQYSSVEGLPNDWHLIHLGSRAVGGAGLVMVEASAVCPEGRISPQDSGIWNSEQASAFQRITKFIADQGAIPAIQLAHAGRKASTEIPWLGHGPIRDSSAWTTFAPSPLPFSEGWPTPVEMNHDAIERTIESFVQAAHLSREAGFQVVEIHAAHGYLLHQFLSPLSNQRKDEYGGSLENRMRLALRVARAVRETWRQDLPVFVRISATDWVEGGWDLESSIALCRELKTIGVDLIDCSSGGNLPRANIPVGPHYQVGFAESIRQRAQLATGAVGLITEAKAANAIIESGQADAVFLARELLRDPYWPLRAAAELDARVRCPPQYERAEPFWNKGLP